MATRPTTVQETAIREAINNDRIGDATTYADRTLETMQRNGWITRPDSYTYRVTADAARAIHQYTLADRYRQDDLLATNPKAQRQAAVIDQARAAGIHAFVTPGTTDAISITVEDLAALLTATRTATSAI